MAPKRALRLADPRAQDHRRGSMKDDARAQDGVPEIHIRTFNPRNQAFDYTRAGKARLSMHEVDLVAHIPVRIETQRRNGSVAVYFGHFPVSGLPQPPDQATMYA